MNRSLKRTVCTLSCDKSCKKVWDMNGIGKKSTVRTNRGGGISFFSDVIGAIEERKK